MMSKRSFDVAFAIGLLAVGWVALGFVGHHVLALSMTALITAVYLLGAWELRQFRAATAGLQAALAELAQPPTHLDDWLDRVPPALRQAVRGRIEGPGRSLPGPALTPYLVGLLVMLGMLGTFLGMVVTFQGAVFALEGSADLQAMRGALAEPIKGLGLAFGTSVAGVAASATLGLMSALSRRERMEAGRQLDLCVTTVLRPYSPSHQREAGLQALQAQADALPQVVTQLQALMARIESRSQQLDEQLLARHERFQRDTQAAHAQLADSVARSLERSLVEGGRAAGDSIAPVVRAAMAQVAADAQGLHARLGELAQSQVDALSQRLAASARAAAQTWSEALQAQQRSGEAVASRLQQSLEAFSQTFEARSTGLLAQVQTHLAQAQDQQAEAEARRLAAWTDALHALAGQLQSQWQQVAAQAAAQQQALGQTLERASAELAERASAQAHRTLDDASQLLARSEELVRARVAGEAQWHESQGQRMESLAQLWRNELGALRDAEAARAQAAVERLGQLEATVAGHLATLGASLEAPLSRLLHTASEVPQAAAGVIAQLREEMSRMTERDNLALQDRTALLAQLGMLVQTVTQATGEQRQAVEALVTSGSAVMQQAGERFARLLQDQAGQAQDTSAQLGASAVELASVGDAFAQGVQQFQASSDQLLEGLQRIEAALARSTARSDEQLAYYVAQAREVIDLSISAQQGVLERLQPTRVLGEPVSAQGAAA